MDTNALTISSLEIAELTGSDKDNVKLTMEGLSEKGLITFTATQEPTRWGRQTYELPQSADLRLAVLNGTSAHELDALLKFY